MLWAGPLYAGRECVTSFLEEPGGFDVVDHFDLLSGENLLLKAQQRQIISDIANRYDFVFLSPPCCSFCIALEPTLRYVDDPWAEEEVQCLPEWASYVGMHNAFVRFAIEVIRACTAAGVPWLLEHPASRRRPPAKWGEHAHKASIWDIPELKEAAEAAGAVVVHLAQCSFGGRAQKWTCVMGAPACEAHMRQLLEWPCVCTAPHEEVARGYDEHGVSRSAPTAAYPPAEARALAQVGIRTVMGSQRVNGVLSLGAQLHVGSSKPHGTDGAAFTPEARASPAGSMRQLEAESNDLLKLEPLPVVNELLVTEPDEPPASTVAPPGPFTDEQLIPDGVRDDVMAAGKKVVGIIERARRSSTGAKVARGLRPKPLIYREDEALNPCGRGYRWRKRPDGLWHAVLPSREDGEMHIDRRLALPRAGRETRPHGSAASIMGSAWLPRSD